MTILSMLGFYLLWRLARATVFVRRRRGRMMICTRCGTAGRAILPRVILPGATLAFPCCECGCEATIPAETPEGRRLLHLHYPADEEPERPRLYGIDGGKRE